MKWGRKGIERGRRRKGKERGKKKIRKGGRIKGKGSGNKMK